MKLKMRQTDWHHPLNSTEWCMAFHFFRQKATHQACAPVCNLNHGCVSCFIRIISGGNYRNLVSAALNICESSVTSLR